MTTARLQRAMKGDAFNKHLRASSWNTMVETVNRVNGHGARSASAELSSVARPSHIYIKNKTGGGVGPGNVLTYNELATKPDQEEQTWNVVEPTFEGTVPQAGDQDLCILFDGTGQDGLTEAWVDGVVPCRLKIPANGDWLDRAGADPGAVGQMLAAPNGPARIIWREDPADPAVESVVNAVVHLGPPQIVQYIGKTVGDIEFDETGTVELWRLDAGSDPVRTNYTIDGVRLDWMHGDLKISDDKQVLIQWHPVEKIYRIIGAECEDTVPSYGGSNGTPDTVQALTSTFAAPLGMVAGNSSGSIIAGDPDGVGSDNGVGTNEPGHYELRLSWTAEVNANNNNAGFAIEDHLGNRVIGPTQLGRSSGDTIGSTQSQFIYVDESDIPPGGYAYSKIEAWNGGGGGSDSVTWKSISFNMVRL